MSTTARTDFQALPTDGRAALDWTWQDYQPFYDDLLARELTAASVEQWLSDNSRIGDVLHEHHARLNNAYSHDTRDAEALKRLEALQQGVLPNVTVAGQQLKEKLLASGLEPDGLTYQLRAWRAEAAAFRDANVPLQVREQELCNDYNRITGAMTAELDGEELTMARLRAITQEPDRGRRERAWRAMNERMAQDRPALNATWTALFDLRREMATNADCPSYREYVWPLKHRFDYSIADAQQFHAAIEEVVVPALRRSHERRAELLGLERLRPWDLACDVLAREPLRPFSDVAVLEERCASIFRQLDPELGDWFEQMRETQLDLANTTGKAPGGWCNDYPVTCMPHIFMNAVGSHDDVQTLLHEAGHAFHCFSTYALPYGQQRRAYMEFAEVASMAMELLAAPYLAASRGGFYSDVDAARATAEHLEHMLYLWCMLGAGDSFQHWMYTHPDAGRDAEQCAAKYAELWQRYFPVIDYAGLEDELAWQWQRTLHFYIVPFYYIEYGLAQLGASQVWRNSLTDPAGALEQYKAGLRLGGTTDLPTLYETAGAKLAFDARSYGEAVEAIEARLDELAAVSG